MLLNLKFLGRAGKSKAACLSHPAVVVVVIVIIIVKEDVVATRDGLETLVPKRFKHRNAVWTDEYTSPVHNLSTLRLR